jgi:decaprenyl-phosphate phosphoribosyltransferase
MRPVSGGSSSPPSAAQAVLPAPILISPDADRIPAEPGAVMPPVVAPVRPPRSRSRALLALARPRQWIKNALVIAAPGAAGALTRAGVPLRVISACIAFCLLSAGIYALNDVRDRAEDRLHPRKRLRPVASGEVGAREAVWFGAAAIAVGLIICLIVTPLLAVIGLGYIVLTISYSLMWRNIPWVDLVALAAGFVLRAAAGGVAAPVHLSRWFVLVITFCALFVAVGKRLSELLRAAGSGRRPRRAVRAYTETSLQRALLASAALALFAYCVWAFEVPLIDGIPWRLLTIIPFAECLRRYGRVIRAGAAEAPEDVLASDRGLALMGLLWFVVFTLSVNAA